MIWNIWNIVSIIYNDYNVWYIHILSNIYIVHNIQSFSHPNEQYYPPHAIPCPQKIHPSVVEIHINHVHMILAMRVKSPAQKCLEKTPFRQKNTRHGNGGRKKRLI